jgi:hypothetical protein
MLRRKARSVNRAVHKLRGICVLVGNGGLWTFQCLKEVPSQHLATPSLPPPGTLLP